MHFYIRRIVCVSEGALYHFGGEGVLHRLSRCLKRAVRAVVQGMVSPRGAMYLTIQVSVFYALVAGILRTGRVGALARSAPECL